MHCFTKYLILVLLLVGCGTAYVYSGQDIVESNGYNELTYELNFEHTLGTSVWSPICSRIYYNPMSHNFMLMVYVNGDFVGGRKVLNMDIHCVGSTHCIDAIVKSTSVDIIYQARKQKS